MSKLSTETTTEGSEKRMDSESLPSKAKTLHISKPLGHVTMPSLICGGVAAVVSIALSLMSRYDGITLSVLETYEAKPFYLENANHWHQSWDWVLAAILAMTVAFVVLDSAGKGKRILFGVIALILTMMCSPLIMLWGAFWLPITSLVAIVFAWIFAYVYTSLHIMPCELGVKMKLVKNKKPKKVKKKKTSVAESKPNKNPVTETDLQTSFKPIDKVKAPSNDA